MKSKPAKQTLLDHVQTSLADASFVSLRLSGPASPDSPVLTVDIRVVDIKGAPHLSLTHHETRRDTVRNLSFADGLQWVANSLGAEFRNALLRTTRGDWQFHHPTKGRPKLTRHKPTTSTVPDRQHDRSKERLLDERAADWLIALDILAPNGHPRASMRDKQQQISRYVELLHHLARDCGWTSPQQPSDPPLHIADMGCGKGYLTFAAWHLFHRILRRPVEMTGIEERPALVDNVQHLARQLNAEGLNFRAGSIQAVSLSRLDALIALHACNTATDDAILKGIEHGARLIVVAPCCHQSLRPLLGSPGSLAPLLRHGLLKERLAEWLTDGLRTLFLEWAGYQCKVIEFVTSEHTTKNLMIAAVRRHPPYSNPTAKAEIRELMRLFELPSNPLDSLLEN